MRIPMLVAALAGAWLLGGCQETTLSRTKPQIVIDPRTLSFGQVSLLTIETLPLKVSNEGTGYLEIMGIAVLDDDGAFWVSSDPYTLVGDEDWELSVSFAPVNEELHASSLRITCNDPETPVLDVDLDGTGVRPVLSIEPLDLYFDTSEGAEAETDAVVLESIGSGPVVITGVDIMGEGADAYSFDMPEAVSLPYSLAPGLSIEVEVEHEPVIGEDYEAALHIYSNDLNDEDQVVSLWASGTATSGDPPEVEITSPVSGFAVQEGGTVDLHGTVTDIDQEPPTLVVYFQSDLQGNLGTVVPTGVGNVSLEGVELDLGTHMVSLVAIDDDGNASTDVITVLIWDEEQTFDYVISGGDTEFHYFFVDDDIAFYLNDSPIWVDDDDNQNLHAPVSLTASPGDVLRIVATDQVACTKALDALYLHLNESNIQDLNDAISVSACDDHDDYDPDYEGPWPNDFLDEQFEIAIP